jgi:transcriptional regulator with XRE-family HTH domain
LYNGRRAAGLNGRRAAGLNVDTCADSCGLSRSFLHMVEQGRRAPALAQMLAIADAYQVERREAAWAWILQTAPDVAIYLIRCETVEGNTMLQRHFSDQYEGQVREREEARKAANAARREKQNQKQAEKRAQLDRVQAVLDKPTPVIEPFGNRGIMQVSELDPTQSFLTPRGVVVDAPGPGKRK